ncbi:MAG TPA: ribose 5-phosphate isomerase B [Verrucomicrobiae bacterium]|jgi:ribose 5-phosphate isomerase B|nr:ribose 5-phosphate isomerase B [Verrucomicrobiae bacterium]
MPKIAFACDHRGFDLKQEVFALLKRLGYDVADCGTNSAESCDYPDPMFCAGEKVASGECVKAIGICHSGIGSTIAANKVKGVRAALCHTEEQARLSRQHNDANMLVLGSGIAKKEDIEGIITTWLNTSFEGGRHERRVHKIREYENRH